MVALGLLVPGFHHARCTTTLSSDGAGESVCAETFPRAIADTAALIGIAGALLTLAIILRLARAEPGAAARALLALGALALLVPTLLPLAGWASAGFDLAFSTDGRGCRGDLGGTTPLWLQTSTCVTPLDVLLVPLGAVAGALAAASAGIASSRLALAAAVAGGAGAVAYAASFAGGDAHASPAWTLPLLGVALVAASVLLLRRADAARPTAG